MKTFSPSVRWLVLVITGLFASGSSRAADKVFSVDVAPLLAARCLGCHTGQKAKGDYRLHTFKNLIEPGNSDAKPIVPGKPEESELFRRLVTGKSAERMPPGDDPLSADEIATIKSWILAGATFDKPDPAVLLRAILPPRNHPSSPDQYPAPAAVFALAFSPDGRELAVGGVNEILIRDAATGKLLRRLPKLPARIHSITYTADGKSLLVAGGTSGEYGEVALADARSGKRLRVFGTFDDVVLTAAFSSDGKTVVAGSADRTARAWLVPDGVELWRSTLHSDWITSIAFSKDGRFVATASKDRTVKVLEAGTGKLFTTFNGHRRQYAPHAGQFEVYALAFDATGIAYSVGGGSAIRAWEPEKTRDENGSAADMEDRFKKAGHTRYLDFPVGKPVFAMALGDGQLFSAGGDRLIRQHDAATGKIVREFTGHADWIYAVAVHRGTNRLASGGFDGEIRVWDTKIGNGLLTFKSAPE